MATWEMFYLQDPNSPYSDNLFMFYNLTMMMMYMIIMTILYIMMIISTNHFTNRFMLKNHTIEIIWTLLPMLILIFIAFPSLKTLYFIDEIWNPIYFTVKIIGHQWYWSYEYSDFNIEFDSYMTNDMDNLYMFRLLEVDNRMIIPYNIPIRLIITSADVIHSWTIPSLGLKIDAMSGRLNQLMMFNYRPGLYFGQCSEICGTNHSFMPIILESTSMNQFMNWLLSHY